MLEAATHGLLSLFQIEDSFPVPSVVITKPVLTPGKAYYIDQTTSAITSITY